ncbi:putative mitochondrial protein [Vitis vinifera]|uniref:Putative mitochondrial protein n=1 Tax=Vitis vinifera TaxID=29760 RepID=A0A438EQF7_VITVI|nr:putative mitochondrial protein [Vitis vinifera]
MMFALKDLGPLNLFLGIEVHKLQDGNLHLNQGKYATNLLERAKMLNAKSMSTCMITDTPLLARLSDLMEDPPLYRSIIGALHYVTIIRLEILYCVKQSLSIHAISLEHSLEGYFDFDWVSNLDDKRSTLGYCVYLGGNLVSWSSKKQQPISRPFNRSTVS